jgi:hypothetical protein
VHTKPGVADRFIADFVRCTEEIMKDPNAKCGGQVMFDFPQFLPETDFFMGHE